MKPPPPTRREVVTDTLHGVTVADPYRWLEDGDDPEVQQWVADQNRYTRQALDARPDRDAWHERLVALMGLPVVMSAVRPRRSGVHLRARAGADQYVLALRSLDEIRGRRRSCCSTRRAGAADAAVAVDWFEPSPDGSTGRARCQRGRHRELDVAGARGRPTVRCSELDDLIPNTPGVQRRPGSPTGPGFLYTRYPEGDEYHRTVHHHRLGDDPADDPVVWAEHVDARDVAERRSCRPTAAGCSCTRWSAGAGTTCTSSTVSTPDAGWRDVIAGVEVMNDASRSMPPARA